MKDVLMRLAALRDALTSAKQTETSLQGAYDLAFAIGAELASDQRTTETESDLASDILDQISSGFVQLRLGHQPILALARADTAALKSAFEQRKSGPQQGSTAKLEMARQLSLVLPPLPPTAKPKALRKTVRGQR